MTKYSSPVNSPPLNPSSQTIPPTLLESEDLINNNEDDEDKKLPAKLNVLRQISSTLPPKFPDRIEPFDDTKDDLDFLDFRDENKTLLDEDVVQDVFNVTTSNIMAINDEEMLLVGDVAEENLDIHNGYTSNTAAINMAEDVMHAVVQDDLLVDQEDLLTYSGQDDSLLVEHELTLGLLKTKVSSTSSCNLVYCQTLNNILLIIIKTIFK